MPRIWSDLANITQSLGPFFESAPNTPQALISREAYGLSALRVYGPTPSTKPRDAPIIDLAGYIAAVEEVGGDVTALKDAAIKVTLAVNQYESTRVSQGSRTGQYFEFETKRLNELGGLEGLEDLVPVPVMRAR